MSIFDESLPDVVKVYLYNLDRLARVDEFLQRDTLRILYRSLRHEIAPLVRLSLLKGIIHEVRTSKLNAVCLLSVAECDSDPQVVDLAVVSFLELSRVEEEDPFAALGYAVQLLERDQTVNRGAVHASIACFGDRRVCAVLKTSRNCMNTRDAGYFYEALARPGQMKLATLDYLLDWVIDHQSSENHELLDLLASALSAYLICAVDKIEISDRSFNFGPHCFPSYTRELDANYQQWLVEIDPLIKRLEISDQESLKNLVAVIRDPSLTSLEEMRSQGAIRQRIEDDRRGGDRRVVNIAPLVERRDDKRRLLEARRA